MCTFWGLVLLVCGGCALTWVRPGDDSWSVARLDWTSLPEGPQPTEVAFAETPDDVQQVLRNTTWTKVCVRSGRHSYTLFSLCNGTVIDLSRLNDVSLLTGGLVRVGGGVRNWNAALLLAQRNVTWVGGTGPSVGAGYALGGGYSLVSRAYGMACDNIVEAEIVLGSGAVVVANATNTYADLFWALRGAGNGNFGAVTHVTYKLPTAIPEVTTMWDLAWSNATDALAVVTGWEDFLLSVFSDKRITPLVLVSADGTVRSSGLFLGRQVQLMPILDKWLDAVPAASSSRIWEASWLDSLVSFGGCGSIEGCTAKANSAPVPGSQSLWTAQSAYVYKPLGKAGWARLLELVVQNSCCHGHTRVVMVDPYGGQISQSAEATSFVHRDALFHFQIIGYMVNEPFRPIVDRWANELYWTLRKEGIVSRFSYQNYPNLNMSNVFRNSYFGDSFSRLLAVKQKYDPFGVWNSFAFAL